MKKTNLKSLFASICALPLIFGAASCSDGSDSGNSSANTGSNNSSTETLATGGNYSVLADGTSAGRKAVTASSSAGTITLTVGESSTTYSTIAAALTAAASASGDCVITLGTGTYEENGLTYSGSNNLKISGLGSAEYGLDVAIYGQGSDTSSEKGRSTFAIAGSGNITLENLTIKSSRAETEGTAQAEVIGTDGTGNLAAYNCSFISGQDTLRTVAKAWFYKCYIEGDVDFLWMEYTNGVAALYEECVIRAIGTRTTKAYFTAPRLGLTSKVGKGVVIYNSTLEAESGLEKLYLGRNPWSSSAMSDYYEQVAIIGSQLYLADGVTLNSDVWGSAANGTSDQKYIGFKTDDYFPAGTYGTRIGSSFIAKEYAGRENILNRVIVVASKKFQKDVDTYWDIAQVISDNGWTVTADSSSSLLSGETDPSETSKTYTLDTESVDGLTCSGFALESGKSHYVGQSGSTITFPVTGNCVVTVTGYYKGEGTIQAGSQGAALFNFNNGSTSKYIEKSYSVYSGACDVTITATATTYITKIVVEYDDSLTFTPVSSITVSAADSSVDSKKTLQFSYTLNPSEPTNDDVVWSITSGSDVASIDQAGLLTAGSADADTSVTVRVTSCDANSVYGEATVTVKKLEASAFDISWLDSDAHSDVSNVACTDGNESIATGSAGTLSSGTVGDTSYGSWQKNSSKWGSAAGGLSFVTTAASAAGWDAIYIDFPVTAVTALTIENVKVTYGSHGTGNPLGQISYSLDNGSTFNTIATDESDNRNTTNSYDTSVALAAGKTAIIRVALGNSTAGKIASSKSPTICTVTVSGSAAE
ncbi:Ig-like domain-containing protein [Treponema sp.]|uniref:Ig-like domain-containing protein n=1 Tax=Treponema sp. TaxID=166 RepID=UPI00388E0AEC